MKNEITIQVRVFPLIIQNKVDGYKKSGELALSKEQLRAAQIVGQSSKELIERICERHGYKVIACGKPERREFVIDLQKEFARGITRRDV